MKTTKDMTITTTTRTIKVDSRELEIISAEFDKCREKKTVIPEGFYTSMEYSEMMKISYGQALKALNELVSTGKMIKKSFTHYTPSGRAVQVIHYKLKT